MPIVLAPKTVFGASPGASDPFPNPVQTQWGTAIASLPIRAGSRSQPRGRLKGHEDQFPLPRLRVRYVLAEAIFDETRVNG